MLEIKKNLKSLDIKVSKFAYDLGISRPTLDAYIENFENGHAIPNEEYQKIFDYLFSGDEINSLEFAQKVDYVKRVMLSDAKIGAEKVLNEKRQDKILKNVKDILETGTLDTPFVEFINLFMNNRDKELVKAIYMYFNFTNGFLNLANFDLPEKEKALYSHLAKIFSDFNDGSIEILQDSYNKILEKNKNIFEKKQIKVNDSDIVEYIKSNLKDSNNLNIDVIKQMIESMEG